MEASDLMHLARLALVALLCCMTMRDTAAELADRIIASVFHAPAEQLPHDDGGEMPVPLEGEEGESPVFKLKFETDAWSTLAPVTANAFVVHREQAESPGFFSCSRELFDSLHRLRI